MTVIALFFSHGAKKDTTEDARTKIHDIGHKCFKVYFFFAVEFASAMSTATWYVFKLGEIRGKVHSNESTGF
jgi:hypothetical protein